MNEAQKRHMEAEDARQSLWEREALGLLYAWMEERKINQTDFPQEIPFPEDWSEAGRTKVVAYSDQMPEGFRNARCYCLSLADIARALNVQENRGLINAELDWHCHFGEELLRFMKEWFCTDEAMQLDGVAEFIEEEAWGPLLHLALDNQKWIHPTEIKITDWMLAKKEVTIRGNTVDELKEMLQELKRWREDMADMNNDKVDLMMRLINNLS